MYIQVSNVTCKAQYKIISLSIVVREKATLRPMSHKQVVPKCNTEQQKNAHKSYTEHMEMETNYRKENVGGRRQGLEYLTIVSKDEGTSTSGGKIFLRI